MSEIKSYVLSVNGGSSSLKFGLYQESTGWMMVKGQIDKIGGAGGHFSISYADGQILEDRTGSYPEMGAAMQEVIRWLKDRGDRYPLAAIGHRLVQGGPDHRAPELIDEKIISSLEKLTHLAPNHLPPSLALIAICRENFPAIPQVACYDTDFHKDMPLQARHFAIPRPLWKEGIIRYGFHGLSYEFIMQELGRLAFAGKKDRIIIAHLGNGCSMTAVYRGRSIDTTMGLTPTGGLVMGTRSGDLDPGLLLYLLREKNMSADELEELIEKRSGLEGLSGEGHDVQTLLEKEATHPEAAEALALFCYQAKKYIGALTAALGGLDTLIFTGGIGENSPVIRHRITDGLQYLGLALDEKNNTAGNEIISSISSKVMVCAIRTNEEMMIARHTIDLYKSK